MNQQGIFKKWLWAGVMGILTILLCLIVSDDLLGLNSPPARSQIGALCFLGKPDRFAVVILQVRFLAVYIAEYPPLFFAVLSCL